MADGQDTPLSSTQLLEELETQVGAGLEATKKQREAIAAFLSDHHRAVADVEAAKGEKQAAEAKKTDRISRLQRILKTIRENSTINQEILAMIPNGKK